jgi:hypothetical protein
MNIVVVVVIVAFADAELQTNHFFEKMNGSRLWNR